MREIKFRAWSNYVNDMFFKGDNYGTTHDTDCINYARSQDVILMQYTGLKDKNGKEIYEGDIVIVKGDGEHTITSKVTFGSYGACVYDGKNHIRIPALVLDRNSIYTEVIGNIYESPELLEEE